MEHICSHINKVSIGTIDGNKRITPNKGIIYWHIPEDRFTPDMDKYKVILQFEKAFQEWGRIFHPIQFKSTSHIGEAHLTIGFYKNGDPKLPFKFDNGVLAYAFAPGSHQFSSDMFFNEDYKWEEMHTENGINLFKVAVHEMGHTFNLGHSTDIEDVMYPIYQPNDSVVITEDTIEKIKELYGEFLEEDEVVVVGEPTEPDPIDEVALAKKMFKDIFKDKKNLNRLTETQLVLLGKYIGLKLSVDDLKRDSISKILIQLNKT